MDSGRRVGNGHVMRCLNLADQLRREGASITFVCRADPGNLIARIERSGFVVHGLPAAPVSVHPHDSDVAEDASQLADANATQAVLPSGPLDWVVVDHYELGHTWEAAMRPMAGRVLAIDDMARTHDSDLLLDQNWFGDSTYARYRSHVPERCRLLLGPRFALLGREYPVLRAILPPRQGEVRRLVVFLGGSDPDNRTLNVLQALSRSRFEQLAVDLVVGPSHPDPDGLAAEASRLPHLTIHRDLDSLAGLLTRADLAIGAGGATTWERACLGLPGIVTAIARNQEAPSQALAAEGRQLLLGDASRPPSADDWAAAIATLLDDHGRLTALGRSISQLTDGYGAARVARAMAPQPVGAVQLRPVQLRDEGLLLEWANDPVVRRFSLSPARISAAEHHDWLARRLCDAACWILIAEDASGLPVGQIRFDFDRDRREAVIDISIDSLLRGCGAGGAVLSAGLRVLHSHSPHTRAIAEVVEGNTSSDRLFRSRGFVEQPSRRAGVRSLGHDAATAN